MSIYETILNRRTIRKFSQKPLPDSLLLKFVNAGRVAPSAANLQPLEYIVVRDKTLCEAVFKHLRWAAYIAPEGTPKEKERPVAYIVILANSHAGSSYIPYDVGAAVMSILLYAWEEGVGGCWIKSIDKTSLETLLNVPENYEVNAVLALGYRAEEPVLEESDVNIKYWKDSFGVLHVPKRKSQTITHWEQF